MFVEINRVPHEVEAIHFVDGNKQKFRIHASHARTMVFNATTYIGVGTKSSQGGYDVDYVQEGKTVSHWYDTMEDALFWTAYRFLSVDQ